VRGRKPKPIEQKLREGNPGNRKLPAPVRLPAVAPVKPDDLPPDAAALWDELAPVLAEAGVLNAIDAAAFTAMCLEWHTACLARRVLAQEGHFALGSTGQIVQHPALQMQKDAHAAFLRFAEHFGITPVARARIAAAAVVVKTARQLLEDDLDGLDFD